MDIKWSDERMSMAQKIVMERFALNSVAGHLAPHSTVAETETTFKRNRFDFDQAIVIDRETFDLFEPYSFCRFSKAQFDEFAAMQGEEVAQTKAVTTLTRAASSLARWHDVLFFIGFKEGERLKPPSVEMPPVAKPPQSLRDAAREAEDQGSGPVNVDAPFNEGLVSAFYEAVSRLEGRGYFTAYHLVLGEDLWRELHRPTSGSLVLPRDRIKDSLMGGDFHRTTTLPANEALLASRDGPTFDDVIAGDPAQHPRFAWLRVEPDKTTLEEFYLFRVWERFAPRVRENRAIVRLVAPPPPPPKK